MHIPEALAVLALFVIAAVILWWVTHPGDWFR